MVSLKIARVHTRILNTTIKYVYFLFQLAGDGRGGIDVNISGQLTFGGYLKFYKIDHILMSKSFYRMTEHATEMFKVYVVL